MSRHYIPTKHVVLRAVRLYGEISRQQLFLSMCLEGKRSKALEALLPAMEKAGELTVTWFNGEKVYSIPRKNRRKGVSLEHELGVTEVMIRLWRCRMKESEFAPKRAIYGFAIVPDGALVFSKQRGTMILDEFHTRRNFHHSGNGVLKSKLTRYHKHLAAIENFFQRKATVLFVIDAPRLQVKEFVDRIKPTLQVPVRSTFSGDARYPYFFVDFSTFKSAPIGKVMTEPIFYWQDGKEWPLAYD